MTGLDFVAVFRVNGGERASFAEDIRQGTGDEGRYVKHYENRYRQVRGKLGDHFFQSFNTARGGSDDNGSLRHSFPTVPHNRRLMQVLSPCSDVVTRFPLSSVS